MDPDNSNPINFRSHFYAPRKYFMGMYFETFWFNITIVWIYTALFYVALYYELLTKALTAFGKISIPNPFARIKLKKFFTKFKRKK